MARFPILILLLGVLAMSVTSSPNWQWDDLMQYEIEDYPWNEGQEEVPSAGILSYELFPGIGYYKFYPEGEMSYFQALTTCKNDGGHLAIINSKAEMLALKSIYDKYGDAKYYAWLGFNDIEKEGRFETIFGQPLEDTGYVEWHSDEPDSEEKGEDCGAMDREGKLHDLYCTKHAPWPFFCEIELFEDQELVK